MDVMFYFLIASAIGSLGISLNGRHTLQKIKEEKDDNGIGLLLTKMFMNTAIIEAPALVLIVFGFLELEKGPSTMPQALSFLVLLIIVMISFVIVQTGKIDALKKKEISNERKSRINTTTFMIIGLFMAIPIIAFIAVFLSTPM